MQIIFFCGIVRNFQDKWYVYVANTLWKAHIYFFIFVYICIKNKTDDSDAENDTETKNDDDKSETNGGSAVDSAENGDATAGGDDEGYEVEDIVDHKIKGKKKYFKIRWKNYDESQDTWEPEDDLSCPEIIERYLEKHPEAAVAVKKTPKKEKKVNL